MWEIWTGEGGTSGLKSKVQVQLGGVNSDSNLKPHIHLPTLPVVWSGIQIFGSSPFSITDVLHTTVYVNWLCDKHDFFIVVDCISS